MISFSCPKCLTLTHHLPNECAKFEGIKKERLTELRKELTNLRKSSSIPNIQNNTLKELPV